MPRKRRARSPAPKLGNMNKRQRMNSAGCSNDNGGNNNNVTATAETARMNSRFGIGNLNKYPQIQA